MRAELPNPNGVLKPGMFMTVKISAAAAPALLVPEGASCRSRARRYVFVVKDGVASKREVTLGRRTRARWRSSHGLTDGERVVVEGTQKVRDGIQVRGGRRRRRRRPSPRRT